MYEVSQRENYLVKGSYIVVQGTYLGASG